MIHRSAALICVIFILCPRGALAGAINPADQPVFDVHAQADQLEDRAVEAIDQDRMQEGLDLMVKAIALDPAPVRHMNYGSVLFGNGVSVFKKGEEAKAKVILRQAQEQILKAIQGFDKNKDKIYLSQCYFLLGEMSANAFAEKAKAKEYYERAVALYDNPAAQAALKKLNN